MAEGRKEEELKQQMGEELYAGVRERLEEDPDYDPKKFSSAEEYYRPQKK